VAAIITQTITTAGLAYTTAAASGGGDTATLASATDVGSMLIVKNGAGAPVTVTIADPGTTPAGNSTTAPANPVAAGATAIFPLLPAQVNPSTGTIAITYSAVTSVTVAVVRR
jgi:hypothetical protein